MTATAELPIVWEPHPGSQTRFLTCPHYEVLYEGTRGPGKTDALLMDFAQHVGEGFGANWRGILFRQTYPQLSDVIAKSKRWFYQIWQKGVDVDYNASSHTWRWSTGEELLLRHMQKPDDYWKYHGHEYPWIGWEELTNWPTLECYDVMKSCSRSSFPGMPRKYRATANPYGRGHNAVKARFIDPAPAGVPIKDENGLTRVTIHGSWRENEALLEADPDYPDRIAASATNPEQRKAWLDGDWDIVAGGMFDDVWSRDHHVLVDFRVPPSWRVDRSFDWGSSKPFSVGWWAESDGTGGPFHTASGKTVHLPRGSLVRFDEWYGWNGTPNTGLKITDAEIGKGIAAREDKMPIHQRVKPGPADSSIFDDLPGKTSPADELAKHGAKFTRADKSSGSRNRGWEAMRRMFKEARKDRPEDRGLWVTDNCRQFIRTIPTLPRDDRDPDDIDTETEDHIADETRYRILSKKPTTGTGRLGVM